MSYLYGDAGPLLRINSTKAFGKSHVAIYRYAHTIGFDTIDQRDRRF